MKSDWAKVDKFFREHGSEFTDDDFIDYIENEPTLDEMLKEQGITYEEALSAAENEQKIRLDAARQSGLNRFEKPFVWIDIIQLCEKEIKETEKITKERLSMLIWLISNGKFADKLSGEDLVHVWLDYKILFDQVNGYKKQYPRLLDLLIKFDKTKFSPGESSVDYEIVFNMLTDKDNDKGYANDCKDTDNLHENLKHFSELIAKADFLEPVKPLIYYQLFINHRKKLLNSDCFNPDIKKLFNGRYYNIYEDNGKNFNQYAEYCNLYADLKKCFPNADKELCDAGFLVLSNIAEWRCIVESMGYDCVDVTDDIPSTVESSVRERFVTCFDDDFSYKENDVSPLRFLDLEHKYPVLYRHVEKAVSEIGFEELAQFADDPMKFCEKFWIDDFTKAVKGKAHDAAWRILFNAVKEKFDDLLEHKIFEIFDNYIIN